MTHSISSEAVTAAWDELVQRVEKFVGAWEVGAAPDLAPFAPDEPPLLRRLVLAELIKVDLERRLATGAHQPLEAYLARFPELCVEGEPPCDLIYEEFHLRRMAGQAVSLEEYRRRFPRHAEALKHLVATDQRTISTQLCAAALTRPLAVGQRVDDFDLLAELGHGAFARVYLARQVSLQRLVALKVSADKGYEPQTLASLEHPHIVRVYDQRRVPDSSLRLLYMQLAPGGTLADVIRLVRQSPPTERDGRLLVAAVQEGVARSGLASGEESPLVRRWTELPWSHVVCRLGTALALALDHAHRQGVLHRDVKPANVLLAADGLPKLADFNISFAAQVEGATPAAYFGGSLAYMSPEQMEACDPAHPRQAASLDGRSDLYSLGVVLWELLHGTRPFADEDLPEDWSAMLQKLVEIRREQTPWAPGKISDPVALRLEAVLRRVLMPEADQRPADGQTLARELALCLHGGAWNLRHQLGRGWRNFARRHPVLAMFPVNLPPFVLAGAFNLWFNVTYYVPHLEAPMQRAFWQATPGLNALLYLGGIGLVIGWLWPLSTALGRLRRGQPLDPTRRRAARRRALHLGLGVAGVGLLLWLAAGVVFPLVIHAQVGRFPLEGYVHFLLSMVACGLISCCCPFLATTWLSLRVFFPALLDQDDLSTAELQRLDQLGPLAGYFLFTSPVAPLMAMLLVLLRGGDNMQAALLVLILVALLSFAAAYVVYQKIQSDLAALQVMVRPTTLPEESSQTVSTVARSSSSTSSRRL